MNKDAVVLLPCYDPDEKIMKGFLEELAKEFKNIVLVDDGCSKKHTRFMNNLAKSYPVIKHNVNLGKGRGLKNGINYILNNYPKAKVIVTADCDGQHSVKDIKKCFDASLKYKDALILGCRNFKDDSVPFNSKNGNRITRNVMNHLVGQKISDTQTGLRAMSLDTARKLIEVNGERYEYETNVLIAAKKMEIEIKEVEIETIYINKNETSHFNPVKDSIKIYRLFAPYILVTLFAYILETVFFAGTYNLFDQFWSITLFLLLCKLLSTLIILLLNKHISFGYTIINFLLVTILATLISKHVLMIKILIDVVMFIIAIFVINFDTKKVA